MTISAVGALASYTNRSPVSLAASLGGAAASGARGPDARGRPEGPPPPPPGQTTGADARSLFQALAEKDDADGDGLLSQSEIDASPVANLLSPQFSTLDADGDGLLSQSEVGAVEAGHGPAQMQGPTGDRPAGPPPASAPSGAPPAEAAGGTSAKSLYESLFSVLSEQDEGASTVTLDRDLAQKFLTLLQAIA